MDLKEILDLTWIPILAFALSFCSGIHMLIIKRRPSYLKKKDDMRPMKDEERYAKEGGRLLIFFALGAAIMCALLFVNQWMALAEIVVFFLVFSVRWRDVEEKYGPIGPQ